MPAFISSINMDFDAEQEGAEIIDVNWKTDMFPECWMSKPE